MSHVTTAEAAIQPAAVALMPKPLSQRSSTVSDTVMTTRPATAAMRMKKFTAVGSTYSSTRLFTMTTTAHSAVMPKAAAIQME
jgi:hypothetical protein